MLDTPFTCQMFEIKPIITINNKHITTYHGNAIVVNHWVSHNNYYWQMKYLFTIRVIQKLQNVNYLLFDLTYCLINNKENTINFYIVSIIKVILASICIWDFSLGFPLTNPNNFFAFVFKLKISSLNWCWSSVYIDFSLKIYSIYWGHFSGFNSNPYKNDYP